MPRPRRATLFEIAGQWINTEPGRSGLWRFWYDARTQTVRRARLRSEDLEAAKIELAGIILSAAPSNDPDPSLSVLLEAYHAARTDALPSRKPARAASRTVLAFFGPAATVSDLTPDRLEAFARDLTAKGLSPGYVSRILSVLSAGIRHARIEAPVPYSAEWVRKVAPGGKAPRKIAIPTDSEFAAMLSAPVPEPLFRWMLLTLATVGRPEAIIDLTPAQRRDGLIDLNPPGRSQNKKVRPVVREPDALTPWLDAWERALPPSGRYVAYSGVESVKTAIARLSEELGIRVSPYSFRHKMATVLRRAKRRGVTEDDIAAQMGHQRPNVRITGGYGEFDPDYLEPACKAISAWLDGLGYSRTPPADRQARDGASGKFLKKSVA